MFPASLPKSASSCQVPPATFRGQAVAPELGHRQLRHSQTELVQTGGDKPPELGCSASVWWRGTPEELSLLVCLHGNNKTVQLSTVGADMKATVSACVGRFGGNNRERGELGRCQEQRACWCSKAHKSTTPCQPRCSRRHHGFSYTRCLKAAS
ncbi:unnamed protein product [Pleuronectes platessa]|uniref:Uncharacterized protein n=1 Tax=Pleuronectes platessa TaxID=8262 RepID=A0A9N7Z7Y5_PLEPL|nr:unnamed protein product [Pleuronectes platessa]